MVKYTREENGTKLTLEIDNETYSAKDILEFIEKLNTTIEIKELKKEELNPRTFFNSLSKGENNE